MTRYREIVYTAANQRDCLAEFQSVIYIHNFLVLNQQYNAIEYVRAIIGKSTMGGGLLRSPPAAPDLIILASTTM